MSAGEGMVTCASCGEQNRVGARFCDACGARLEPAPAPGESRRTVTIVFVDVAGSTALGERLDPETLRDLMGRYFDVARAVVERHGGIVEKFIGDAVMAVFGLPTLHEDDALRAVRAAASMRAPRRGGARAAELRHARIGINTGEVVASDRADAQRLVTGDAVNTAARLEQHAPPGGILLGKRPGGWCATRSPPKPSPRSRRRARGAADRVAPGCRISTVGAVTRAGWMRRSSVGNASWGRLLRSFEHVVAERRCGLSPSSVRRAWARAASSTSGPAGPGRCDHPPGPLPAVRRGHHVLAVAEVMRAAAVIEEARRPRDRPRQARTLSQASRMPTTSPTPSPRRSGSSPAMLRERRSSGPSGELLEALAAERPLVVVFDDLQWAESTFLDLVEHLVDGSRGAPILVVALARPDLLDKRPTWGGGKLDAQTVLLEGLGERRHPRR